MLIPSLNTAQPKLVVFDFDGTLAANKQPLEQLMAVKLAQLLERMAVGITSVDGLPNLLKMVARLPASAGFANLYLLPASGGALYRYRDGGWDKVYEETIPDTEARTIERALREGAESTGFIDLATEAWGKRVVRRGAEVALLALGADAPFSEKYAWDPEKTRRRALLRAVADRLPNGFHAYIGGTATIAVTKAGIDKAYGLRQLCARLAIPEQDALYIGDELYEEGNDEPVLDTNAQALAVRSPADTARAIVSLLAAS